MPSFDSFPGARSFAAIVPSDVTVLNPVPRHLIVTVAGTLVLTSQLTGADVAFAGVVVGQKLDVSPTRVKSTGTTATVVAVYG